ENNNHQEGVVYWSDLCAELTQNQSPGACLDEDVENENIIVEIYRAGDYVGCNLSSVNFGKVAQADVQERLINIPVRMLDIVIDVNRLPLKQTTITNHKYHAIGLGTFGWHHLLALKGMEWESEEAVDYADELYEQIAYLTIQASMELSKEKTSYPLFKGSK